jgi:hypothetical protein
MEENEIPAFIMVFAAAAVVIGITVGLFVVTWAFIFSQV